LLQASIVAVSSDWFSCVSGKTTGKQHHHFTAWDSPEIFAKLRTASNMLRAPKSASAFPEKSQTKAGQ